VFLGAKRAIIILDDRINTLGVSIEVGKNGEEAQEKGRNPSLLGGNRGFKGTE